MSGQDTTTAPIAVRTLDHVTLVVVDLAASREFYVDVLGMEEVSRPSFSFDGSWFQSGPSQVHLILEFEDSGPAGNLVPAERRGARTQHCAFLVDGYVGGPGMVTTARRWFPDQFLHYHRAGHGAVTSPQSKRGYTAFVLAKMARLQGASGIHIGTMG